MKKIGVIFCAYGEAGYVESSLENWIKLKQEFNIRIAAVHGQFSENHDLGVVDDDFQTQEKLKTTLKDGAIDFLYLQNDYENVVDEPKVYRTEAEIRNKALFWLLRVEKVDFIWLLDLDEFYTTEEIVKIINYVNLTENTSYHWFSINMKNYVLDGKRWIDGFCPARIFKSKINESDDMHSLYYDNDVCYSSKEFGEIISYKGLSNKSIPKDIAHVRHLTWLHSNGKKKVQYQLRHFGSCSYKWNNETDQLEFDHQFYSTKNQELPIINED